MGTVACFLKSVVPVAVICRHGGGQLSRAKDPANIGDSDFLEEVALMINDCFSSAQQLGG